MDGERFDYRVYGLRLRANRALPHLLPTPDGFSGRPPDISVHVGDDEQARGQNDSRGSVRLRYSTMEFVISGDGTRIWCNWAEASSVSSIDDVSGLLLGPVLGWTLRLRGTVSLHGCAVAVGSRATVILAEKSIGKSSLAAALAREEHPILSDDLSAITEEEAGWTVHPGYPRLRLRPDTIEAFNLPGSAMPPVFTGQEKRYVGLAMTSEREGWRFAQEHAPVAAIYALERRPDLHTPLIEPLRGAGRLTTLLRHRSASFATLAADRQADELASLGRLSTVVPLRRIQRPDGLEHLDVLRDAILEDLASCV